ncbi:hypothetical protein BP6252_04009 [Coleophoma cylindrospora]|uniref:NmrA-like domain-containing protein n=1 Tax=Coleophoma cylindrospora TaxID=1849047 RepID=A0A3D8RZX2_9HELO|nr:hypothetical protein BP6252_04009 [Coleophoma cylindrospora]
MADSASSVAKSKNILFFGATGTIGRPILEQVIKNKSLFGRLVIFTAPGGDQAKQSLLQGWKTKGLEIIEGDISSEKQVLAAFEGIDTVLSALGRTAIAAQIPLIRLAESHPSIYRFIPSEFGTDIKFGPSSANEKPHQEKLKVRAILEATKKLDYTYIVTGPFADGYLSNNSRDPRIGTWDVKARTVVLLGTGKEKVALTTMRDVGKLTVAVLKHPDVSSKRALKVKSFVTTPDEILAEFQRQTQTEGKWNVSYSSLETLKQLEAEAWASKVPPATFYTLRRIWTEGATLYDQWDNDDIQPEKLDTLEDAVKLAIEQQV